MKLFLLGLLLTISLPALSKDCDIQIIKETKTEIVYKIPAGCFGDLNDVLVVIRKN